MTSDTTVQIDGLALEQHDHPEYPGEGVIKPYTHQIEMYDALTNTDGGVYVNTAPTGGGKTWSWGIPTIATEKNVFGIYPTNALLYDQEQALAEAADLLDLPASILVFTKDRLKKLAEEHEDLSPDDRGEIINREITVANREPGATIVLMNPDIFTSVQQDRYWVRMEWTKEFHIGVVDEFHRAGQKQQNTLLFLLDALHEDPASHLSHLVFLSATPDMRLTKKFEHSMSGEYTELAPTSGVSGFHESPAGDAVMPPVNLRVSPGETFGVGEELQNREQEVISFCQQGKTVIILDGLHEVTAVYEWLTETTPELTIKRVEGFHGGGEELAETDFDVLVSNSAVEVGVDFDVEQILFAAGNAASFLQRLGRLRRRACVSEAWSFVPKGHYKSAKSELTGENSSEWISRASLRESVQKIYPSGTYIESFDWTYSAAEGYSYLYEKIRKFPSEHQERVTERLRNTVHRHFYTPFGKEVESEAAQKEQVKKYFEKKQSGVVEKLKSYRENTLQAVVYDTTVGSIQTYNIFYLLRHGEGKWVSESVFEQEVPQELQSDIEENSEYNCGWFIYTGEFEAPDHNYGRDVYFSPHGTIIHQLNQSQEERDAKVVNGINIKVEPAPEGFEILRESLEEEEMLCYPIQTKSHKAPDLYDLDPFFFLYSYYSARDDEFWSVATGFDALYIDCITSEDT